MDEQKKKAIDTAMDKLRKKYGQSAIMWFGESGQEGIRAIPTGSLALDLALGVGGWPRGRVVEVYGPEGSGKTTIALHAIAEAQRMGELAAMVDVEHALDPSYAERIGVNMDDLIISQPDSGEEALEVVEGLIRSGGVGIVALDSVAALVPRAEIEGEMGASLPGLQARLMSQALRKLKGAVNESDAVLMFVNQIRHKIGVMFGSPEVTSGGLALKFYASVRLEVRRGQALKQAQEVYGHILRMSVKKNKVAPPFRKVEVDLIYGRGISREAELLDLAVEYGVVDRTGSHHYRYEDVALGHGKTHAAQTLAEDTALTSEIEQKVREAAGLVEEEKGGNDVVAEEIG